MGLASRRWVLGEGAAGKKGALGEAEATGRNPTDRGKSGTKRHLLTEGRGVPTALLISGANRTDMKKLAALLDAVVIDRPSAADIVTVEEHLCLDRGYDYAACREAATERGYLAHIPPKANAAQPLPAPSDPERHPPRRWVVEVAHSWFNRFRRVLIRWDKKAANYLGFVQLAAMLIIYRKVRHARSLSG